MGGGGDVVKAVVAPVLSLAEGTLKGAADVATDALGLKPPSAPDVKAPQLLETPKLGAGGEDLKAETKAEADTAKMQAAATARSKRRRASSRSRASLVSDKASAKPSLLGQ